jgi:hypothetical protein
MKQLKVIVPSYSTTDGIFRASFKDTVTIDPNSKVIFDKIAFTISQGNNTNISLPESVIQINTAANYANSTARSVVLPGANYATSTELCRALNTSFNSCLDSEPLKETIADVPPDLGLAFYNTSGDGTYKFQFAQAQNSYVVNPVAIFMSPTTPVGNPPVAGYTVDAGVGAFSLIDQLPLLMGAFSASTSLINFNNATSTNIIFNLGLYSQSGTFLFGIQWDGNVMSKVEGGNVTGIIPNPNQFNNTVDGGIRSYFFVKDGLLHFALADMSDVDPTNWVYLIDPIAFTGYNVNTIYNFGIDGDAASATTFGCTLFLDTNDVLATPNAAGDLYYLDTDKIEPLVYTLSSPVLNLPVYLAYNPPTVNIFERSVRLNFSAANALWYGLNLGTSIVQTPVSTSGIINGLLPIGFIANQEYELDILDLPLESYVSNPNRNSGRVNGIIFFTPILLNPGVIGSSNFVYDNRNLFPLSIKNEYPMVLESMSFRLFSPSQPSVPINFEGISFNMYIKSKEDE